MNRDRIEGNWMQLKGAFQERWSKLTGDDTGIVAGRRDHTAGTIQNSYGISRDAVKKQLSDWQKKQRHLAASPPKSNHRTQP